MIHDTQSAQISQKQDVRMLSWKQCVLPVIAAMVLWQLMHINIHIYNIYLYTIYIYIQWICRQQLFRSLRVHQYSSGQKKISKDQSAQTTARVVSITYRTVGIYIWPSEVGVGAFVPPIAFSHVNVPFFLFFKGRWWMVLFCWKKLSNIWFFYL